MQTVVKTLSGAELRTPIGNRQLALWLLPGASSLDLQPLLAVPWHTVWCADPHLDPRELRLGPDQQREPLVVNRLDQDHDVFRVAEFVRVYNVRPGDPQSTSATRRRQHHISQLKYQVENAAGLLCFVGDVRPNVAEIQLACDLAPNLIVLLVSKVTWGEDLDLESDVLLWGDTTQALASVFEDALIPDDEQDTLALKDAPSVRVPPDLLEDVSEHWTLLTRSRIAPRPPTQDSFDGFLAGKPHWDAYVAGAAYRRKKACAKIGSTPGVSSETDFLADVSEALVELENAKLEPNTRLQQVLLYAESGSGASTLLRQAAVHLAQRGYPTLITKPFIRAFGGRSLEQAIIAIQDAWQTTRRGKGSGVGLLPVCLFVDTDAETAIGELPRRLQALGRKLLIVRAMERSRTEIDRAHSLRVLRAEVPEAELVELGSHLFKFAQAHGLARMPSSEEWRAYHQGMKRVARFHNTNTEADTISTPDLFLVGIHPFVMERVSGEDSLEQYYYRKWNELDDDGAKELVRVLAAAGTYGLSIPYDTLRRHPELDMAAFEASNKALARKLDVFVGWQQWGWSKQGWHLYIRHQAMARLLSRALDPFESNFPYSPLIPLLRAQTTKHEDVWFAGALAFRIGKSFKSRAPQFNLETDTAAQRAARAIFTSIPPHVKDESRSISHHEARYHLHVLRACREALDNPSLTTLSADEVRAAAEQSFMFARTHLLKAEKAPGFEPLSYIFNTLATSHFTFAEVSRAEDAATYTEQFSEALDFEERAVKADPANSQALFQYVQRVHQALSDDIWGKDRKLELFTRAEAYLDVLVRLHTDTRWRNIDPIEAEKQLGALLQDHQRLAGELGEEFGSATEFSPEHRDAAIFLEIRQLLGTTSLAMGFQSPVVGEPLRAMRKELGDLPSLTARSLAYLYRLYVSDPVGRLQFRKRLELLRRLRDVDLDNFVAYRHDEAALYCQSDQIDSGERKFRELRTLRRADTSQWFHWNERLLLNSDGTARELILVASNLKDGWAKVINTDINVKFQPYQYPELQPNQPFRTFIRFTLNGLQGVRREHAESDLKQMGLM